MVNNHTIWALQLIRYFVSIKGYFQVNVMTNVAREKDRVDFWLLNPDTENYSVIHICEDNDIERSQNLPVVASAAAKIMEMAKGSGKQLLDISLNEASNNYRNGVITYVHLAPGVPLDSYISSIFPDMNKVIFNEDGDLQKQKKKLEREIAMISMSKRRKANSLKNQMKLNLGDSSLSFKVILGISVLLTVLINLTAYLWNTDSTTTAIFFGAYYKAYVTIFHNYWRLLTAGFVHVSIFHLICNMVALNNNLYRVEKYYGKLQALIILLASVIVGNLCVYVSQGNTVCVGLSGGIYGLWGALIVASVKNGAYKDPTYRSHILRITYLNVIISLMPNVSALAHLGGFIAGVFIGIFMLKDVDKFLKLNFALCAALILGFLGYLFINNQSFIDFYYGTDLKIAEIFRNLNMNSKANQITTETLEYYLTHGGF